MKRPLIAVTLFRLQLKTVTKLNITVQKPVENTVDILAKIVRDVMSFKLGTSKLGAMNC
jgi:hypothetical protein